MCAMIYVIGYLLISNIPVINVALVLGLSMRGLTVNQALHVDLANVLLFFN